MPSTVGTRTANEAVKGKQQLKLFLESTKCHSKNLILNFWSGVL